MDGTTAPAHLVWSELDDEIIVLDTSSGDFYSLNKTATEVWKALEAKTPVEQIAAGLASRYGIDPAQAMADVLELTREFQDLGLRC
jgi:Coenzyme PQQ synthesis protein D (PqqD)